MPTSLRGAAAFVVGFWLALELLLPLVVPDRDPTRGSVLDAERIEAGSLEARDRAPGN